MGRHIRWQAIITFTGIALTLAFLGFLSFSRQTISLPDTDGTYREGIAGAPQLINPLLAQYNQVDQDLTSLIFEGLTRSNGEGGVEPVLAESWQVSNDGLAYLFKLRRDVRWQDNEPFQADDVIFTIGLMQDPDFPGVPYLGELWRTVTVQKLDDYTVRFILPEPFPAFVDFTTIGLLPQHLLADISASDLLNHPFNLDPIGTGPYQVDRVTAQFVRLSINPVYHETKPRLTEVEFRFYPTYQETIAAYQAGEIDSISYIPPQAIPTVQNLNTLNLYSARMSGYTVIYLNLRHPEETPFFAQPSLRQALMFALDRPALINQALNGQGMIATGPIRAWNWAYNPNQPLLSFDQAKARGMLEADGWFDRDKDGIRDKDGRPFSFTLLTSDDPDKIAVAEMIKAQWQQIGINITLDVVGAGLSERLNQHNFEAALVDIRLSGDPDPYPLWHETQIDNGQNYGGWNNDQASLLLETARTITNTGRRNDFYYEFQDIFAEEVPALILFYPVYTFGVSEEVFNVQVGPMSNSSDRFRTMPDWYKMTRRVIYSESQFDDEVVPERAPPP